MKDSELFYYVPFQHMFAHVVVTGLFLAHYRINNVFANQYNNTRVSKCIMYTITQL
jgi:hypothetical protein